MTYQSFLVAMMTTPDSKLVKADIARLAEKYGVAVEWAEMTVAHWIRRAR